MEINILLKVIPLVTEPRPRPHRVLRATARLTPQTAAKLPLNQVILSCALVTSSHPAEAKASHPPPWALFF